MVRIINQFGFFALSLRFLFGGKAGFLGGNAFLFRFLFSGEAAFFRGSFGGNAFLFRFLFSGKAAFFRGLFGGVFCRPKFGGDIIVELLGVYGIHINISLLGHAIGKNLFGFFLVGFRRRQPAFVIIGFNRLPAGDFRLLFGRAVQHRPLLFAD